MRLLQCRAQDFCRSIKPCFNKVAIFAGLSVGTPVNDEVTFG
jgi:hypothetical protein